MLCLWLRLDLLNFSSILAYVESPVYPSYIVLYVAYGALPASSIFYKCVELSRFYVE